MKLRHLLAAGALLLSAQTTQAATFINIVTGGTSGVFYPIGVALQQIYSKSIPDSKVQVQATKGSAENMQLIQKGSAELALSLGDSVSYAWNGNEEAGFPKKLDKLRAIATIYPNVIQIVALKSSNVKSLADFKGKRISVGAPRSGTELNARAIFRAAGLTYQDFAKVDYLPFGDSVELMKNRQIDITVQSAGLGVAALRDLSSAVEVVFIPVPPEIVAKINDPSYLSSIIPANTYNGQTEAVHAAAVNNIIVTSSIISDEIAYLMTKGIFENLDHLASAHSAAKGISLENAIKGLPIPLHPGAEKYYKEKGLIK